ncbi:hypothetical protein EAE96_010644 [Botrytis aclada]|nr:hypothetical protein EAE96_010644 [Botrytis aclada]
MHCVAETRNSYVDQVSINSNRREVEDQPGSSGDALEHYRIIYQLTEQGPEDESLMNKRQSPPNAIMSPDDASQQPYSDDIPTTHTAHLKQLQYHESLSTNSLPISM